jgi:hypothetical protein
MRRRVMIAARERTLVKRLTIQSHQFCMKMGKLDNRPLGFPYIGS